MITEVRRQVLAGLRSLSQNGRCERRSLRLPRLSAHILGWNMIDARQDRSWRRAWLLAALAMIVAVAPLRAAEPAFNARTEQGGLALEATISRAASAAEGNVPLRSGEPVTVRFRVSDLSGKAISGAFPNGWMVLSGMGSTMAGNPDARCRLVLRRLQVSSLPDQAEVDLNTFLVLALNEDATVSVIDPRSGFGGTRLLGLVALHGNGEDWVQLPDQERLAVTVPEADAVDIVDMRAWNGPVRRLDIGARPRRVALQPDRTFFWVDTVEPATGVASAVAVNADTLTAAGRISIGPGPHDFAFSADSRFLFVANAAAGTVSVIDVGALAPVAQLATGPHPVSLAYSELANAVYVADSEDGSVTVIDARSHTVRARIAGAPGIAQIGFAPAGRYAFVVNPRAGTVTIIDSALDRVIYTVDSALAPDRVTFTSTTAYVRQAASPNVMMLPLDRIGVDPGKLPAFGFPGGSQPPATAEWPSPAAPITPVAGDRAVLIANGGDREIYYYQEGLAVPMGSFSNYKRVPRAVTVVRRDLRESAPGIYQTDASLGRPGSYDLVFRLNQPPFYHCFSFEVAAASVRQARRPPRVAPAAPFEAVAAGHPVNLDFVVTDVTTGAPVGDLTDLTVLVMTPAWQIRQVAAPLGDGRYSVELAVPIPGLYAVVASSANAGIDYQPMPGLQIVAPQ
jgi:YVTN family beta-propeller protein